ncbi:hypothetical protein [uncultured Bacteroides sp.]|uniref:hypothetical protein n=1 Tax=uncultured Bacteroides sp. TaxID=162156 RepID=UPI002AAB85B8|nr:hypothetical protein [uncultured Bacteroides sp.]
MKKIVVLFVSLFLLSLGTASIAQTADKSATTTTVKRRGCFVDENKDNVCDRCQKGACARAKNYKSGKTENACNGSGYPLTKKAEASKTSAAAKATKK